MKLFFIFRAGCNQISIQINSLDTAFAGVTLRFVIKKGLPKEPIEIVICMDLEEHYVTSLSPLLVFSPTTSGYKSALRDPPEFIPHLMRDGNDQKEFNL